MEEKEIDINNEEQILKNCGFFNYFYNCEECSRELCMFYNDIVKQKNNFNTRQALIDLGRIAITLNQQPKRIKELENENKQLKQQLHDLPKKIVEEITNELSNNTSLYFEMRESTSAHCPNKKYEWFNYVRFRNYINTILKKFGAEDESNND